MSDPWRVSVPDQWPWGVVLALAWALVQAAGGEVHVDADRLEGASGGELEIEPLPQGYRVRVRVIGQSVTVRTKENPHG